MADWDGQERTEQATSAKREDARRRGQIPRSVDLSIALSLLCGFAGLYYLGPWVLETACEGARELFGQVGGSSAGLSVDSVHRLAVGAVGLILLGSLPLAACGWGVAVAATVLQVGVEFRVLDPWPDFGRLGLWRAARRILSGRSLVRGCFVVLKLLVVGGAVAWLVRGFLERVLDLSAGRGPAAAAVLGREAWGEWWRMSAFGGVIVSLALVGLAILEYLYQRWQHERDLRMTKGEVEEENLRLQGNVQYKSLRRHAASARIEGPEGSHGARAPATEEARRRRESAS